VGKWPTSRWGQGWIAFVVAGITAYLVFVRTENVLFEQYAKQSPYDGQDGMAAFMGALQAGGLTIIGVFIALFVIQRAITSIVNQKSN
jgi:hypothetical protein